MNLLLLNIKTDSTDHVLGFTTDWINELSKQFNKVFVISIHVGEVEVEKNVRVFGLQDLVSHRIGRVQRILKLYSIFFQIVKHNRIDVCFSHMNIVFPLLLFPFFKCLRIPMAQWYAHRHVSWMLRLVHLVSDRIFTTSNQSFNLESNRKSVFGHAISTNKFRFVEKNTLKTRPRVISTVGRISRIKRLEIVMEAVHLSTVKGCDVIIHIIGSPITKDDHTYKEELVSLISRLNLETRVRFLGAIPFKEVSDLIHNSLFCINAAPTGALDKAVLEAWSTGTPCLVTNEAFLEILEHTGFDLLVRKPDPEDLSAGIEYLIQLDPADFSILASGLSGLVGANFSLPKVCGEIGAKLRELALK